MFTDNVRSREPGVDTPLTIKWARSNKMAKSDDSETFVFMIAINPTHSRHFMLVFCGLKTSAPRKLCFHFLSHLMGYDRGESFPFDFEPNGIQFGL